jgi:lauroyl/myristoyl acyltransferase
MNGAIEKLVDENRAQYQWEYKRFKKPAAGSKDLYRR